MKKSHVFVDRHCRSIVFPLRPLRRIRYILEGAFLVTPCGDACFDHKYTRHLRKANNHFEKKPMCS